MLLVQIILSTTMVVAAVSGAMAALPIDLAATATINSSAESPLCEKGARTTIVAPRQIEGDFEIIEDPSDPLHLLVTTNDGPRIPPDAPPLYVPREDENGDPIYSNVLLARLNAVDGSLADKEVIVASNYQGRSFINGPEFVLTRRKLGLVYAGPDGVHSVWRKAGDTWDAFHENEDGSRVQLDGEGRLMAEPIAVTAPGRFPYAGSMAEHLGHVEFFGLTPEDGCQEKCYGLLNVTSGTTTDVAQQAAAQGFYRYFYSTALPHDPQGVVFSGCRTAAVASCGLYRAKIDGFGNLSPAERIAQGGPYALNETLIADAVPIAGGGERLVVMAAAATYGAAQTPMLDIWACDDSDTMNCAAMTLQQRIEIPPSVNHFRTVVSPDAVYLHYLVRYDRPDVAKGSYVVEVRDGGEGTLLITGPDRVTSKAGAVEILWASIDASLRFFWVTGQNELAMCRLTP